MDSIDLRSPLKLTFASLVACLLTTAMLYCALHGNEWFARSAGAAVLVSAIGALTRLGRFPAVTIPVVQAAGVLIYLTVTYAATDAQSGWLPGKSALRDLKDLGHAGFHDINTVTPPVTPSPALTFLIVTGVALMAILADFLAAGLRSPELAGLPLLVAYLAPAMVLPGGVEGWLFLLPGVGYLLLLITDSRERLLRWGVAVSGQAGGETRASGELGQMTRRIGVTVLSMAILIPALAPRLTHNRFGPGGINGDDPGGGGTISTLNPLVTLRRDLVRPQDVDLMKVSTTSLKAGELYLRAVTLDTFDGEEWKAGKREVSKFGSDLPKPVGLADGLAAQPVVTTVQALPDLQSDYVPMPYPATKLSIDGQWRVDPLTGNVVSRDGADQISGKSYTVDSVDLDPKPSDVTPAISLEPYLQSYVDLPDDLPGRVKELADRVTRGQNTVLGKAIALQQWFRNPNEFVYDLRQAPGTGKDAILAFLHDRRGYCEQFAATMAVMARYLGIPARVDVGFTPGTAAADGTRTVSAHDAHAWPELWMPGVGWTRFEPTPGTDPARPDVPNWLAPKGQQTNGGENGDTSDTKNSDQQGQAGASPSPVPAGGGVGIGDGPLPAPNCVLPQTLNLATQTCVDPAHSGRAWWSRWWKQEAAIALVLLLLLAPGLTRLALRRRRWALAAAGTGTAAEWAWLELRDSAVDLGYRWPEARTPRQTSAELATEGRLEPAGTGSLAMLTQVVERVRYAPPGTSGPATTGPSPGQLHEAVESVRDELRVTAGRNRRVRALLLPRSVGTLLGGVAMGIRTRAVAARRAVFRRS